jgi:hypothetical protein
MTFIQYGSRVWKDHESRYSQAKLELYGLLTALPTIHYRSEKLFVEMDAEYIKGMLNNPDLNPNRTLNHWIATIKLFNFKLQHVPAESHKAPDGFSHKPPIKEDIEEAEQDE